MELNIFICLLFLLRRYDCESENETATYLPTTTAISEAGTYSKTNASTNCAYFFKCSYDIILPLSDSNNIVHQACCSPCSSAGNRKMECCPDMTPCTLLSGSSTNEKRVCIPLTFKRRSYSQGILAKATCKEDSDDDERAKCLQKYDIDIVEPLDVIPITDKISFEVYRNIHCALCNGFVEANVKYWLMRVYCKWTSNVDITKYADILRVINTKEDCEITFENPYPENEIDKCDTIIDRCNLTSYTNKFTPKLSYSERQAMEFKCEHRATELDTMANMTFKNKFCTGCNGFIISSDVKHENLIPDVLSFSTVFGLDNRLDSNAPTSTVCKPGMVYFHAKDQCVVARCSLLRRLHGNSCERMIHTVESFTYKIVNRLKTSAHIDIQTGILLIEEIGKQLEGLIHSVFKSPTSIYQVFLVADETKSLQTQRNPSDIMNAKLLWIDIRSKLKSKELHDPEEKMALLLSLAAVTNISVNINKQGIPFQLMLKDDTLYFDSQRDLDERVCKFSRVVFKSCTHFTNFIIANYPHSNAGFIPVLYYDTDASSYSDNYEKHDKFFTLPISSERNLLEFRNCPFLPVSKNEHIWHESADGLYFTRKGYLLSLSEFVYGDNKHSIWVCMDKYETLVSDGISVSLKSSSRVFIIILYVFFLIGYITETVVFDGFTGFDFQFNVIYKPVRNTLWLI